MAGKKQRRTKISAPWLAETATQELFEILGRDGGQARIVGGAVRDAVLGIEGGDVDFATTHLPQKVTELVERAGHVVHPTGIDHGTVTVVIFGHSFEVTTLRQDIEPDGRRSKVVFGTDWKRDAERRDFTLNALYCDGDGTLFDPLGGLEDCQARVIAFIGSPQARIAEDYLRIYRYFRFCATHGNGKLVAETVAACLGAVPDIVRLAPERISAEMLKLLDAAKIAPILAVMAGGGLIEDGIGEKRAQTGLKRYEGLLAAYGGDLARTEDRLALLLAVEAVAAKGLSQNWRLPNRLVNNARSLAELVGVARSQNLGVLKYRAGDEAVRVRILAYCLGYKSKAVLAEDIAELRSMAQPVFPLRGADLIGNGMRPGVAVGDMLALLEGRWIKSGFLLSRKDLLALKRDHLAAQL